jgi:hypothetical protein
MNDNSLGILILSAALIFFVLVAWFVAHVVYTCGWSNMFWYGKHLVFAYAMGKCG